MNDIETFLQVGPFKQQPGSVTKLANFSRQFVVWLDHAERQLFWCQKKRIERALAAAGFATGFVGSIGRDQFGATNIFDLSGPGSRVIASIQQVGWVIGDDD